MTSLRDRTISGIFWALLQNVGGKGISFIVMIILARLLTPKIFGLIGMLMIFIQLSQVLVRAGFNQALIQKKNTDDEDYSSVFWINLIVGVGIYVVFFFAAPWVAMFYDQPVLTGLLRALSIVFVINSFSYVQEAKLQKEMRFKTLTVIHIPSTILGGVVAIVMAIMDFGVWSIIFLQLTTRFAYAVQIWVYAKWKPVFVFNVQKARKLFSFGGKLMISGILATVFKNIYFVVIGKFFPVSAVGYYQNANQLVTVPSTTISGALNKVSFSSFSSIQDDDIRLKEGYRKIIQQVLFWVCPIFVLAGVIAEPLFRFVFTEKWLSAVPYFQILCMVGIMYPLNSYNLSILNVKGRSDLFLKLDVIKVLFKIIGIILVLPFGIFPLLFFEAIYSFVVYFVNSFYSGKFINYSIVEQLKDIGKIVLLSAILGIVVYGVDLFIEKFSDILRLLIECSVGIAIYWCGAKLWRMSPYEEFNNILKGMLKNKGKVKYFKPVKLR